jgi:hypothetical protein
MNRKKCSTTPFALFKALRIRISGGFVSRRLQLIKEQRNTKSRKEYIPQARYAFIVSRLSLNPSMTKNKNRHGENVDNKLHTRRFIKTSEQENEANQGRYCRTAAWSVNPS